LEQRFEYAVSGPEAEVARFCDERTQAGDYVSEQRAAGGHAHALVLTRAPVALSSGLAGVSFGELRAGAGGALGWLWARIDEARY
jgi:hypothetical protein